MRLRHLPASMSGGMLRFARALRRTRRNDTEYLLASPENARWILAALKEARTGRIVPLEEIDLDAELGRAGAR